MSQALPEVVQKVLQAKAERRKQLAQLPPEEKLRILVQMQKWARAVHIATGRPPTPVWNLEVLMSRERKTQDSGIITHDNP